MPQQISLEAGFESYRERAVDLFHENVLLKAQVKELQTQVDQLTAPRAGETTPSFTPSLDDEAAHQAMR